MEKSKSQKGTAHHRSQTGGMLASLGAVPLECQNFPPRLVACEALCHRSETGWKILCILKKTKQVVVFVIGMTVLLFGITLIILPGQAIIVIPLGLLILASEFVWAKKVIEKMKKVR